MPNLISLECIPAMNASETATGVPAQAMLEQYGLLIIQPPHAVILDNACGADVVTARLFEAVGIESSDLDNVSGSHQS